MPTLTTAPHQIPGGVYAMDDDRVKAVRKYLGGLFRGRTKRLSARGVLMDQYLSAASGRGTKSLVATASPRHIILEDVETAITAVHIQAREGSGQAMQLAALTPDRLLDLVAILTVDAGGVLMDAEKALRDRFAMYLWEWARVGDRHLKTKEELIAASIQADEDARAVRNQLDELRDYLLSPKFQGDGELAGYVNVNDVLARLPQ